MKLKVRKMFVEEDLSVKEAMRKMSEIGEKILFVVNNQKKLLGTVTDGDIRRWVLAEGALTEEIKKVYNPKPFYVDKGSDVKEAKEIMLKEKLGGLPVLDEDKVVDDVLLWDRVWGANGGEIKNKIDIPVLIMAGGKGTRLDPFTKVLPKPLIPIGEKTIIEIILDKFKQYGTKEYYISINHKSRMMRAFFEEVNTGFSIHFVEEKKPLGTAGSLKLLEGKIKKSLIVSNCDIIIDADYNDIVDFHYAKKNDITIVGSFRHFTVPYGICQIEEGGNLVSMQEKPEYDLLVNTGMYVINKSVFKFVKKNKYLNMTSLIDIVKDQGGKVGVFPIDEKSWIDVGQWEDYHRAIRAFELKQ